MEFCDPIIIVGAPRSGSTWLHLMMGSHPEIATGQESQIFAQYLSPLYTRWQRELEFPRSDDVRKHGIATYLTEEEFIGLLRHFAVAVFHKSLRQKSSARIFLEKSPNSTFCSDLILRCFPESKFIHIIRDGRDVVTSLLMAARGWGRAWAPRRAEDAALLWLNSVSAGREAGKKTPLYTEVRYEALLSDGPAELKRMFDFAEVSCGAAEAETIYERFRFEHLASGNYPTDVFKNPGIVAASGSERRKEPAGFFRKGATGDWMNHLGRSDLSIVDWIAGDLLAELGYLDSRERPRTRPVPLRMLSRRYLKNLSMTCFHALRRYSA